MGPAGRGYRERVKSSGPAPAPASQIPGSLSLVLPAYNEEANIEFVVRDALNVLPSFTNDFEIIVVNDGSQDTTREIVTRLASSDDRVRPVHHTRNRGYGAALTSGFRASRGDYVMFMDADRQFDIRDLRFLAPFAAEFDVVAGFRKERNDPLHRRLFAECFNVVYAIQARDICNE